MEMFLMALALSLLGVVVSAVLFAAATNEGPQADNEVRLRKDIRPAVPARFFADVPVAPPVPIEVLLLQLERHIQLERAAAENFLNRPTRESLHSATVSPLVH